MPLPGVGWDSFFAVGNESVWGTPIARTKFFEVSGITAGRPKWPSIEYPAFRAMSQRTHGRGLYKVMAEVMMPGNYTGLEYLWMHLFGKAPVVATPGGGTLARTQTYTFDDATALAAGLTGEIRYGSIQAYLLEGLKVIGASIAFNEDKTMDVTFRFAGMLSQPTTATTATYPERLPIWWDHIVAKKGTVAFDFRSGSVDIDLGIDHDRRQMGNVLMKEPVRGVSKRKITWKVTADLEDVTTLNNLLTGTATAPAETAMRLQFIGTGALIEAGQNYSFDWDMPACFVEEADNPIGATGIIPQEISGFAEYDTVGAAEAVTLITKNKVTAVP